ncbi:MAG: hypothetical protein MJ252_13990 [archaeon]|nr:hypothetical protein [archaeon]
MESFVRRFDVDPNNASDMNNAASVERQISEDPNNAGSVNQKASVGGQAPRFMMANPNKKEEISTVSKRIMNPVDMDKLPPESSRREFVSITNSLGKLQKSSLIEDSKKNPDKYIPVEEAIKDKKSSYFKIGLLAKALESQGVTTVIKKKQEDENVANANLQMMFSGASMKRKFDVQFDPKQTSSAKALQSAQESVKKTIAKRFDVPENEVVIGDPEFPVGGGFPAQPIVVDRPLQMDKIDDVLESIKQENPAVANIKVMSLLEGVELSPEMFDERGDNSDEGWAPDGEQRGPPGKLQEYFPPRGWTGYGLKVYGRYDDGNNDWLDYCNVPGEWWIAYHGMRNPIKATPGIIQQNFIPGINQCHEGDDDLNHPGEKVGTGVYCSPKPKVALEYCEEGVGVGEYYVAFMCRVNPEKVQICSDEPDYWVVPGGADSIRPYRLLVHSNQIDEEDGEDEDGGREEY